MGKRLHGHLQLAYNFRLALWRQARYLFERNSEPDSLRQQLLRRSYFSAICKKDACCLSHVRIAHYER